MNNTKEWDRISKVINLGMNLLENSDNAELYDNSYLYDYKNTERELRKSLKKANEEGRKLVIGIVGAVKAGKSSFLNALLFDGEQYLPKAITPSTAALTKISYSESPKAIVHFFDKDDWCDIENLYSKYKRKLDEAYSKYCANNDDKKEKLRVSNLSYKEYEMKIFKPSYKNEREKAAVELKQMAESYDIQSLLGTDVVLEGDVISKLNDYVDAHGKYTSIVKDVELMVNYKNLKGLEIVDTPGLCDPVISRGQKTKDYLHDCDVVLLLSRVGEFLPVDTIDLMVNSLPNAGVEEVLVIGSRYDEGILNDKGGDFLTKAKKSKESYEKSFYRNMEIIKKSGRSNELTAKIESSQRIYISSMCYVLDKKIKLNQEFTSEEKHFYNQLQEYSGFKDAYLSQISGLNEVKKALNAIIKKKEEIISIADSKLIINAASNFLKIIYDIKTYVETNNIKLKSMSKEEVEERSQRIQDALVMSRKQIASLFETTGLKCEKKLISIKSILTQEMANYTAFKITTDTSEDIHTVKTGFCGLKNETVKETIITKKASTAQVKINLQNYSARSIQIINDEFTYLFNQDQFIREIKEIIMKAFEAGDTDYEKEDILLPVEKLLVKLTLPEVDVDSSRYIDILNSKFTKGYAEDDEIHELSSIQAELLGKIQEEYNSKIMQNGKVISKIMQEESVLFADELEKKFSSDIEKLLSQMEEQQKYIELNSKFAEDLGKLIIRYKECIDAI